MVAIFIILKVFPHMICDAFSRCISSDNIKTFNFGSSHPFYDESAM